MAYSDKWYGPVIIAWRFQRGSEVQSWTKYDAYKHKAFIQYWIQWICIWGFI